MFTNSWTWQNNEHKICSSEECSLILHCSLIYEQYIKTEQQSVYMGTEYLELLNEAIFNLKETTGNGSIAICDELNKTIASMV